jgi:hypothetical protein
MALKYCILGAFTNYSFNTYLYPRLPVNHSVLNGYKFGIYIFTTVSCGMA